MNSFLVILALFLISTLAYARVKFHGGPVLDSTTLSSRIKEVIAADRIHQIETKKNITEGHMEELQEETKDTVTALRDSLGLPAASQSRVVGSSSAELEDATANNLAAMETLYTQRIRDTLGQEYLDSYRNLLETTQRIGFFDTVLREYNKENNSELSLSERAALQSKIQLLKTDIMSAQLAQSMARNIRAAIAAAWKMLLRDNEEAVEQTKETSGF